MRQKRDMGTISAEQTVRAASLGSDDGIMKHLNSYQNDIGLKSRDSGGEIVFTGEDPIRDRLQASGRRRLGL